MLNPHRPPADLSTRGLVSKVTVCVASLLPSHDFARADGFQSPSHIATERSTIDATLRPEQGPGAHLATLVDSAPATRIQSICEEIQSNPRSALPRLKDNPELLLDGAIRGAIEEAFRSELTLSGLLRPSAIPHDEARRCLSTSVQRVLADPRVRERIIGDIRRDLLRLEAYPREILHFPEISHAARAMLNRSLAWGALPGNAADDNVIAQILREHGEALPDLCVLANRAARVHDLGSNLPRLIAANPRAATYMSRLDKSTADHYADSLSRSTAALRHLGIEGIGRLDNWREIIINRWLVSDQRTRETLESLLQPRDGYNFKEALERSLAPERDNRPLCVFIMPRAHADYNGVFLGHEVRLLDHVDVLTSGYQVVYHEATSAHHAVSAIRRGSQRLGKKVSLLVMAGHGSSDGISLDKSEYARLTSGGEISTRDMELLGSLDEVMGAGAQVVLASCSTGQDLRYRESFARQLHARLPRVTIHAPTGPTGFRIVCDPAGLFKEIEFFNARRIVFGPGHREPTVERSTNFGVEGYKELGRAAVRHPLVIAACFALWPLRNGVNSIMRRSRMAKAKRRGIAPDTEP